MDPQFKQSMSDLFREGQKADALDVHRAEAFEGLLKHPGWPIYTELLNARLAPLGQNILEPSGSVDGAMFQEYIKGTMRGLLLARDLPSVIIATIKSSVSAADGD